MQADLLKGIAETNSWGVIYPEITLGLLALGLLLLELILPKFAHGTIPRISLLGQIVLLVYFWANRCADCHGEAFGGMLFLSEMGDSFRGFFLLTSIFVTYLGIVNLGKKTLSRIEYFHISLVVIAALMLLAQANHFVMLFVALETATVGFYVLVSYYRNSALSLEAGLKYLVTGGLSTAILLFGIVLLYGAAGNPALEASSSDPLNFGNLGAFLSANPDDTLALIGMIMVVAGIAFKIGAFPFQIWIPDVYQGAPIPTTALLAVASKAAGFSMLIGLASVFDGMGDAFYKTLSVIAALTILFGNFGALTQRNLKRLIGLSGVSHAGFLLIGVIASQQVDWANEAILFYLLAYLLASVAVFAVLSYMPKEDDAELELDDLTDLAKKNGFLGFALAVGIGSLAGIPPLAGFIGKLLIFIAAFKAGLYGLLAVAILGVVVSIYYYFGVIKSACFEMWRFQEDEAEEKEPEPGEGLTGFGKLAIFLAVAGTIVLGFFQSPLGQWIATK